MVKHADVTSIHLGSYVSASDPGAVGANKLWVDTSSGPPYQLKRRNAGDSDWESVGVAATGMTNPMDGQGEMIYGGSAGSATALSAGSLAQHLVMRGSPIAPAWEDAYGAITLSLDGGGSAISTGVKADLEIAYNATITKATLLADQAGSLVIDVWVDDYASYPPTDADSICGSAEPTLAGTAISQDSTLTGWTTTLTRGDIIRFNVDSCTTITRASLSLAVTRA